jgi:succinyl-diaminopimelate desuccinylase
MTPKVSEEFLISLAQEMVRIPTVNPPGNERPLAERLLKVMTEGGLTSILYPLSPERASVVGRVKGTGARPALAMVGHIDTVATGALPWSFDPFAGEITDGKLRGRGASDMKSGTAAMLAMAIALVDAGVQLEGDLIIACTAGEEVDCAGAISLLEQSVFDGVGAIVIPEPSDLTVYRAEKGALWLKLVAFGKTSHGSMPRQGYNAIGLMMRWLQRLETLSFSQQSNSLLGSPTLSLGTISGGIKTNVVPDRCEATVDLRTLPGEDHRKLVEEIKRLASEETPSGVRPTEVTVLTDRPAVEIPPDDPLVRATEESVRQVTGRAAEVTGAPYFSDAAVLIPALQVPTVLCGPGKPELAHQPDEYVDISAMIQASRIYMTLVQKILG